MRKVFSRSGKKPKTLGFVVGADTSAVGGWTDEIIGWSLLEKCSDLSGTAHLDEDST